MQLRKNLKILVGVVCINSRYFKRFIKRYSYHYLYKM